MTQSQPFNVEDASVADIQAALDGGTLSVRSLVELYLARIEAFDRNGPKINAVIALNPAALDEADHLDVQLRAGGGTTKPLRGVVLLIKDQIDVRGMPTTLGSVLFKDFRPERDGFVVGKLKAAGAVVIGKATLGELGGGDTHGSLFGSTRNVYDLARTAGGSSGGSGAGVSASFCTVAIGQEGFSSIRRPAIWNGVVGMRPTTGLVSRSGVYGGWPTLNGSLGPMARTVADLAAVLDCMIGYDPADPATAYGIGQIASGISAHLDVDALRGARLGILREPMGYDVEPGTDDFRKVDHIFDRAVAELGEAGATVVDPITIPDLNALLAQRAKTPADDDSMYRLYVEETEAPLRDRAAVAASPLFQQVMPNSRKRWLETPSPERQLASHNARITLMTNMLKVMADHRLDAIVHKAVEHQPTLIADGVGAPFVDQKGAPHINTFLMFVPSVVVPSGFTSDDLPAGITFLGRPYADDLMVRLAYGYEQATHHRRPPKWA